MCGSRDLPCIKGGGRAIFTDRDRGARASSTQAERLGEMVERRGYTLVLPEGLLHRERVFRLPSRLNIPQRVDRQLHRSPQRYAKCRELLPKHAGKRTELALKIRHGGRFGAS